MEDWMQKNRKYANILNKLYYLCKCGNIIL